MSEQDHVSVTRRAFARLTLWGAVGLSFLPGCRRRTQVAGGGPPGEEPDYTAGSDPGLLAKWAELGRLWRELNGLAGGSGGDFGEKLDTLSALQAEMASALDAVSASPELRLVMLERSQYLMHYEMGALASCYMTAGPTAEHVGRNVSQKVKELRRLQDDGTLSEEAARKAAAALARDGEYIVHLFGKRGGDALGPEARRKILDDYHSETLVPQPPAQLAGKRLVELTVDKLGWLAGPVAKQEETEDE